MSAQKVQPRYWHDCDQCEFLGQFVDFDVYVCRGHDPVSIVLRKSDQVGDYASMPFSVERFEREVLNAPDFHYVFPDKEDQKKAAMLEAALVLMHRTLCCKYAKIGDKP